MPNRPRPVDLKPVMTDAPPLRVVIVDDEPLARGVVREFATKQPGVEVVAECANGFEAVKAVSELHPDLLFLDVQMPKLDGFEVLELLGRSVPVIFTTAYDKYALRAFEVHAIDYLMKPFSEERFAEALSRARTRLAAREELPVEDLLSEARPRTGPLERVLIRDGSQVHVIPVDRIDYVEAQDDYVCFKADGRDYLKDQTMGAVEASSRSDSVRPDPPLLPAQHRAHRPGRAVRERQPGRDPARRPAAAGEPRRLRPPGQAAVARVAGRGSQFAVRAARAHLTSRRVVS